jgi:hypothetical protein
LCVHLSLSSLNPKSEILVKKSVRYSTIFQPGLEGSPYEKNSKRAESVLLRGEETKSTPLRTMPPVTVNQMQLALSSGPQSNLPLQAIPQNAWVKTEMNPLPIKGGG